MRSGGEAAKLGHRYEAIWTVHELVRVLSGSALALTVEPLHDEQGIEFVEELSDGQKQIHSVKRNAPKAASWTAGALTKGKIPGRSPLGDLLAKLRVDPHCTARFVSASSADWLRELIEDLAAPSSTLAEFETRLSKSELAAGNFEYIAQRSGGDRDLAFGMLKRIRTIAFSESELECTVDQFISGLVYCADGAPLDPAAVRLLLGDWLLSQLGVRVTAQAAWGFLAGRGYRRQDWSTTGDIAEAVAQGNAHFEIEVESDLAGGQRIPRPEAQGIVDQLLGAAAGVVLVSAPAGFGKSCLFAQVAQLLRARGVPHLALRLTPAITVLTSRELGRLVSSDRSPVVSLAGLSKGSASVLLVDQLDAVSNVSGRAPHLWALVEQLLNEARQYPEMRIVLSCRRFDLEHDYRLRRLEDRTPRPTRVELGPLPSETVRGILGPRAAGVSARQIEMLRTPLHLHLYLHSDQVGKSDFRSTTDLFDAFWGRKQIEVSQRLGRPARWNAVIDRLTTALGNVEGPDLSLPEDVLGDDLDDARAMASEHVLVNTGGCYRFFQLLRLRVRAAICGGGPRPSRPPYRSLG